LAAAAAPAASVARRRRSQQQQQQEEEGERRSGRWQRQRPSRPRRVEKSEEGKVFFSFLLERENECPSSHFLLLPRPLCPSLSSRKIAAMRLVAPLFAVALLAGSVSAGPNAICQWKPACVLLAFVGCFAENRLMAQPSISTSTPPPTRLKTSKTEGKKTPPHSDLNLGGTTIEQTTTASAEECCNKCASLADYKCAGYETRERESAGLFFSSVVVVVVEVASKGEKNSDAHSDLRPKLSRFRSFAFRIRRLGENVLHSLP